MESAKPTMSDLTELLQPLTHWKPFGVHLLPKEYDYIVSQIDEEKHSIDDKKFALFTKWLEVDREPTWDKIMSSLRKTNLNSLANKINEILEQRIVENPVKNADLQVRPISDADTTTRERPLSLQDTSQVTKIDISSKCVIKSEMQDLYQQFTSLIEKIQLGLENIVAQNPEMLSRITNFSKQYVRSTKSINPLNFSDFFDEFRPYFDFLNCELIEAIVKCYLSEHQVYSKLQNYVQKLEEFLDSQTLLNLKSAIQSGLIPRQQGTDTCKVVIKLTGRWGTISFKIFQDIVKFLIGKELFALVDIQPGSVMVSLSAPLSQSQSFVDRASLKIKFMNRIGIIDMYISDSCGDHHIMKSPIDEDSVNYDQSLLDAAKEGDEFEVSILLKLRADINYRNDEGDTALILASKCGHDQIIQSLISAKANVNIQNKYGYSALMVACNNDNTNIISLLLKARADPNLTLINNGDSALIMACERSNLEAVKLLLMHNADPTYVSTPKGYRTTLTVSILKKNNIEILTQLLHYLPNNEASIKSVQIALALSLRSVNLRNQSLEIELLIQHIDPTISSQQLLLLVSSVKGDIQTAGNIFTSFNDIDINYKYLSPLAIAASCGHIEVTELLLRNQADVNIQDGKYGVTPLILASQKDHYRVVKILLKNRANTNIQTKDGMTALMLASQSGHYKIVEKLLKYHADVNIRSQKGSTALILASQYGHYQVVELLLKKHANVYITNYNRLTAHMLARHNGHDRIGKLLLKHEIIHDKKPRARRRSAPTITMKKATKGRDRRLSSSSSDYHSTSASSLKTKSTLSLSGILLSPFKKK